MLNQKTAVIVLSRQHLRPSLKDAWVQNLKLAVQFVKDSGYTLNSSVGTPNWEIITACSSNNEVPLRLVIPANSEQEIPQIAEDFSLNDSIVEFIQLKPSVPGEKNETMWQNRDKLILDSSEVLIPLSIRPNGNLAKLIQNAKSTGREVEERFQVPYAKPKSQISYTIKNRELSEAMLKFGQDYIFHWTRTTNGPWPDERKIDYYKSVLTSQNYPRSAFCTLKRMIETRCIKSSGKNMPDKIPTVSFSGLTPNDAIKLMKWRARYQQMSFEPYGLGIDREFAISRGIRGVAYYDADKQKCPEIAPHWLTQSQGRISDWRHEKEFRSMGDFNFAKLPTDKLVVVCRFKHEALELERCFQIKTIWFCN